MNHHSEVDIFNEQWQCYRWLVDNNVMGHQQLMRLATDKLMQHYGDQKVNLLDLGCGDASLVPEMTRRLSLTSYTAVDLAESVLAIARQNMQQPGVVSQFFLSNIFEPLPAKGSYNLIFSSFAIHHGSLSEKQALFSELRNKAEPDGLFVMIDAIRLNHQSRDDYIEKVGQYFRSISALQGDWKNFVLDHVSQYDFPESIAQLVAIGEQARWRLLDHQILAELPDYPAAIMVFQAS
ncbi:class I SAM-dependent methyltransferase [Endozoicomonas sp. 4G]|uniref:class I SAM-dependent methyltransferase n=1 Tax=Endozoicomonas sp. 4G TaxID=2872754 RepID=UPI002078AFE7|nr:class I SAM-dependent methyltransferase [Endozoicomonas sp. 4G]